MPFVKSMLNGFHAPLHYSSDLERYPLVGLFPNYNESSVLLNQVISALGLRIPMIGTLLLTCVCEAAKTRLLLILCSASSRVEVNQTSSSSLSAITLRC